MLADGGHDARIIEIALCEMAYEPSTVKRGEQIRFVLRNAGKEDHEFLLATPKENLAHAEVMKKHPHMEHDDNGARLFGVCLSVILPAPRRYS